MACMAGSSELPAAQTSRDYVELSIAGVCGLALAFTALFLCVVPLSGSIAGGRDFVQYWATGQQLVHRADPYDAGAVMWIEHSAGLPAGYPVLFVRNPPWALPLVFPLGLVGLRVGAFLWSLALLGCLLLSVRILWILAGRPGDHLHWLGYSFAPALICIFMGQMSLFILLGLVLFLRFHGSRPFLAGASLWLCALKPHLFLPFGVALLLWIFVTRSYKLLGGAALAMAVSCAVTWLLVPPAWTSYTRMMRTSSIDNQFVPCFGVAGRLWLDPRAMWLQYLPVALACAWAVYYYWSHRQGWDWMKNGSLLMLVSLFAAPYCWFYDQGLAIPALLHGAYGARSRFLLVFLALGNVVLYVALCTIKITSALYLWTAPAWLAWYIVARASARERAGQPADQLAGR